MILRIDAEKKGILYVCMHIQGNKWRCGACMVGVILPERNNCRICKAVIHVRTENLTRYPLPYFRETVRGIKETS